MPDGARQRKNTRQRSLCRAPTRSTRQRCVDGNIFAVPLSLPCARCTVCRAQSLCRVLFEFVCRALYFAVCSCVLCRASIVCRAFWFRWTAKKSLPCVRHTATNCCTATTFFPVVYGERVKRHKHTFFGGPIPQNKTQRTIYVLHDVVLY